MSNWILAANSSEESGLVKIKKIDIFNTGDKA